MAAPAAEIARPTPAARLLRVDVARAQPSRLAGAIDARGEISDAARRVADKTMAGSEIAIRRDAEITGARAARVGAAVTTSP